MTRLDEIWNRFCESRDMPQVYGIDETLIFVDIPWLIKQIDDIIDIVNKIKNGESNIEELKKLIDKINEETNNGINIDS